jgi:hypothetical protein
MVARVILPNSAAFRRYQHGFFVGCRHLTDDLDRGHHSMVLMFKNMTMENEAPELLLSFEGNENRNPTELRSVARRHRQSIVPNIAAHRRPVALGHQRCQHTERVVNRLPIWPHASVFGAGQSKFALMNVEIV